jgi:ATP synthase protein I
MTGQHHQEPGQREREQGVPPEENAGWRIFGYLLSGMAFYGAVGWLLSRVTHVAALFPVGMLAGLVLGIVLIVYRYGRA